MALPLFSAANPALYPRMPGYDIKHESIAVAGVDNLTIRSLLDRQQYADPCGDAERMGISSASWPLFGLAWPSGAHLAARLAARPVLAAERILEIGCGLALASLVAHRRGADITASDCHPLASSFLHENLRLNALGPMKYRHGRWRAESPVGMPDLPIDVTAWALPLTGVFDLIIGSDLLYERDADATLATFIAVHSTPAAEIWIVDPNRGNRAAFSRQMAAGGFGLREENLDRPAARDLPPYKGRLLVYQRRLS